MRGGIITYATRVMAAVRGEIPNRLDLLGALCMGGIYVDERFSLTAPTVDPDAEATLFAAAMPVS